MLVENTIDIYEYIWNIIKLLVYLLMLKIWRLLQLRYRKNIINITIRVGLDSILGIQWINSPLSVTCVPVV